MPMSSLAASTTNALVEGWSIKTMLSSVVRYERTI